MSFQNEYEDFLAHYGVKGMKWGVHKSVYKNMTKSERKALRGVAESAAERHYAEARYNRFNKRYTKKMAKATAKGNSKKAREYAQRLKENTTNYKNINKNWNNILNNAKQSFKLKDYDMNSAVKSSEQRRLVWNALLGANEHAARTQDDVAAAVRRFDSEGRYSNSSNLKKVKKK